VLLFWGKALLDYASALDIQQKSMRDKLIYLAEEKFRLAIQQHPTCEEAVKKVRKGSISALCD
jgi:hypothetical protein